ncbi:MAG: hypothetical protein ACLUEK_05010 [Oscillospiraceae bacterium]
MSGLTVPARAKLNLSLDVLARRPDGFHDLRMVMQAAALADEVHELREPGFSSRRRTGATSRRTSGTSR